MFSSQSEDSFDAKELQQSEANLDNKVIVNENKNDPDLPFRVGLMTGKMPTGLFSDIQPLYRGDARNFNFIFNSGFTSRGTNINLFSHLEGNINSAYISTSISKEVAATYPHEEFFKETKTYLYEIHPDLREPLINVSKAIDAMNSLGLFSNLDCNHLGSDDISWLKNDEERARPFEIKHSEIKGAWEVDITSTNQRTVKEDFIPNPNYIPPYPEQKLWYAGKLMGKTLTGVGIGLDGMSLYREYQLSSESGDYNNTYREGARIVGGWTGAYITGAEFATSGLVYCAPLTPYGQAACAIGLGLVGSAIGYFGGSMIATRIYDVNRNTYSPTLSEYEIEANTKLRNAEKTIQQEKFDDEVNVLSVNNYPNFKNKIQSKTHLANVYDLIDANAYEDALHEAKKASRLNPRSIEAYLLQGYCAEALQMCKKAEINYQKAIKLDMEPHLRDFRRAMKFYNQNNFSSSQKVLKKILKLHPNNFVADLVLENVSELQHQANVYLNQSNKFYKAKNYREAIKDANNAILLNPGLALAYIILGDCYNKTGQLIKAAENYRKGASLDEKYSAKVEKILDLIPAAIHLQQCDKYLKNGNDQAALSEATQAIDCNNQYPRAYIMRGDCYFKMGEIEKAISDYSEALELDANNILAYLNRAIVLMQFEYFAEALSDLDKILELDSNNAEANTLRENILKDQTVRELIQYGDEAFQNSDLENAAHYYTEAIAINPSNPLPYFNRAVVLSHLEDYPEALDDLNKVLELDSEDVEAQKLKEDTLKAQEEYELKIKNEQQLLEDIISFEKNKKELAQLIQQFEIEKQKYINAVQNHNANVQACENAIRSSIANFEANFPNEVESIKYNLRKCKKTFMPKYDMLANQRIDQFNDVTIPSIRASYGFTSNYTPPSRNVCDQLIEKIHSLQAKHKELATQIQEDLPKIQSSSPSVYKTQTQVPKITPIYPERNIVLENMNQIAMDQLQKRKQELNAFCASMNKPIVTSTAEILHKGDQSFKNAQVSIQKGLMGNTGSSATFSSNNSASAFNSVSTTNVKVSTNQSNAKSTPTTNAKANCSTTIRTSSTSNSSSSISSSLRPSTRSYGSGSVTRSGIFSSRSTSNSGCSSANSKLSNNACTLVSSFQNGNKRCNIVCTDGGPSVQIPSGFCHGK